MRKIIQFDSEGRERDLNRWVVLDTSTGVVSSKGLTIHGAQAN